MRLLPLSIIISLDAVVITVDTGISIVLVGALGVLGLLIISGFCPKANRAAPWYS